MERSRAKKHHRLAIDIGGTFTDLVLMDEISGSIALEKVETAPDDPARGVMAAVEKTELNAQAIALFIHGTTLGLNSLLERKLAKTGLITTKGFRDVLEIGRLDRPFMYDILYRKPPVLVPRNLRLEVTERLNNRGEVIVELDEEEVRRAVWKLKRHRVESIGVCLLHSYANPAHEKRIGQIILEEYPEAYVSLSHTILQEFYEYERTVSTVVNASIKPIMEQYIDELRAKLNRAGFHGEFLLTRSGGGAMSHREAKQTPVHTVLSGPSGGVQGAAYLSGLTGLQNIIAIDAGGTSFDVSLIYGGKPSIKTETRLAGYKLLLPVLDIQTIGAGGGSIAWIDDGNALRVGPRSAGAKPGPICYGTGGEEPTVTDAAVCLGYIDPDYFLGGEIVLNLEAAQRGIIDKIARPLALEPMVAASGIITIIEAKMTGPIKELTIERGYDPRDFALVAYGGAGPLFAASLAEKIGASKVVIPRWPGNFSAWGMLMFDLVHDFSQTRVSIFEETDIEDVNKVFAALEEAGLSALERDGVPEPDRLIVRSVDMKYLMVGHTITVPVPNEVLTENHRGGLKTRFNELHELLYGHKLDDILQLTTFRVRAIGAVKKPQIEQIRNGGENPEIAFKGSRSIYRSADGGTVSYRIYDRDKLLAGNIVRGPAIIEETASTTVIHSGQLMTVDPYGNLIINLL